MQILRPPAQVTGGRVLFDGEDVVGLSREELRRFRWRNVSMVFQSAMNSLNPVMRMGDQFVDMMRAHERVSKNEALARAAELLELVGIDRRRLRAYPHELSGGMRQRVVIAMALALRPELVIMDEPTTALDVVVQREILQQIRELQTELGFAVLFITHDLSLLLELAHRIAIMYAGEIVEEAPAARWASTRATRTRVGLLSSFPPLHGPVERLTGIPGSPPDLAAPPSVAGSIHAARTAAPTTRRSTSGRSASAHSFASSRAIIASPATGRTHMTAILEVRGALEGVPVGRRPAPVPPACGRRRDVRAPARSDHGSRR